VTIQFTNQSVLPKNIFHELHLCHICSIAVCRNWLSWLFKVHHLVIDLQITCRNIIEISVTNYFSEFGRVMMSRLKCTLDKSVVWYLTDFGFHKNVFLTPIETCPCGLVV